MGAECDAALYARRRLLRADEGEQEVFCFRFAELRAERLNGDQEVQFYPLQIPGQPLLRRDFQHQLPL